MSHQFHMPLIPEYAREYCEKLPREVVLSDLQHMSACMIHTWLSTTQSCIMDTSLENIQVWAEKAFGVSFLGVEAFLRRHSHEALFILCPPNIPWQADTLRTHPLLSDRQALFDAYLALIQRHRFTYAILSADTLPQRMQEVSQWTKSLKEGST